MHGGRITIASKQNQASRTTSITGIAGGTTTAIARFTSLQRDNGICRGQKRNAGGVSINKTMKHTCNYCGGSGMVTCPRCGGTMRRKDA